MDKQHILGPGDAMQLTEVGGKAFALYSLQHLPIPPWLVLAPSAFIVSKCGDDQNTWQLDKQIEKELNERLKLLDAEYVAVRSSAVDEDGSSFSFAGQLESYLGVEKKDISQRIVDVWKSGFTERVNKYREENNLGRAMAPAVIIQAMVMGDAAGVAFSVDPITGRWRQALVSSVFGLGSALVDGSVDADTWRVDRSNSISDRTIADKKLIHQVEDGQELERELDAEKSKSASLTDDQIIRVAQLARQCAAYRGQPQDIEWAIKDDRLYLLQSRPITTLSQIHDPDEGFAIWDNSNIAESYGGVTTPLTYSFARSIYESVYRQFCKLMGVPRSVIAANEETYRGLLGLMHGRMYYQLLNWYRLLACFPGFSFNRGFMDQMMGVQEDSGALIDEILQQRSGFDKFLDVFRLMKSIGGMWWNHLTIKSQVRRFYKRLNNALRDPEIAHEDMTAVELMQDYRDLEGQLLLKWDAPLVNDFFAMIFYGILKKLCTKWCDDSDGSLQNDLVGGDGNVISAEPARRVKTMAALIEDDETFVTALRNDAIEQLEVHIRQHQELYKQYQEYLHIFGNRCVDELKLESPTLYDNPIPLLRAIGHFAGREQTVSDDHALTARQEAEKTVKSKIGSKIFKRMIFAWVLKHARGRVSDRENLRFERTRLFGRIRKIFVEIGKRFTATGVLDTAQDVFYLEKDEILNFINGIASCPDLRGVAQVRKQHFEQYEDLKPIANRFKTYAMPFVGNDFYRADREAAEQLDGELRKGLGCCPGVVRGRVKVVRNPAGVELPAGCILVAERTDPGWIMLFPAASGLLVERGSLLSHSAIVSRELGLPAVVAVPEVTTWLQDGDEVEFDGSSGEVRLIKRANDE